MKRIGCVVFFTLSMILVGHCFELTAEAKTNWSPNGFSSPYCTWYVDGRVSKDGWPLEFSKRGNAIDWWTQVKNAKKKDSNSGNKGDIMVLSGPLSYGHVAYVTSSGTYPKTGTRAWTVRHANWGDSNGQTHVETVDGVKISQCTFVIQPNSKGKMVQIIYDEKTNRLSKPYPLKGFLHRQ